MNTLILQRTYTTTGKRLSKSERNLLKLSKYHYEALIGILLGDGYINLRSNTGNARFLFALHKVVVVKKIKKHILSMFMLYLSHFVLQIVNLLLKLGLINEIIHNMTQDHLLLCSNLVLINLELCFT